MRLIRDRLFFAFASTHFSVDVLNSQVPLVLAILSVPLGLSNASIGLLALGYAVCSSLSQPLFGWLADRLDGRLGATQAAPLLGAGGLLWMALLYAGAAVAPGAWPLAFLIFGGLGSGAFHPVGAMQATRRGQSHYAGQAATAASFFFLFGQAGLALGPAIGGGLLERFGRAGLLGLCLFVIPVALNTGRHVHNGDLAFGRGKAAEAGGRLVSSLRPGRALFLAFALLMALRTWAQQSMITFIPKFYHDQGFDPAAYGLISTLFMGGSALGGLVGGRLGDGWGMRRTIFWSLVLAMGPLYLFPGLHGPEAYGLVFLGGALTGASHSILVVLAQALMPRRMALASGLTLGFMFAAGAVGAYLSGWLADAIGLGSALQANALLVLGAALLSLTLRPDNETLRPEMAPAGD